MNAANRGKQLLYVADFSVIIIRSDDLAAFIDRLDSLHPNYSETGASVCLCF